MEPQRPARGCTPIMPVKLKCKNKSQLVAMQRRLWEQEAQQSKHGPASGEGESERTGEERKTLREERGQVRHCDGKRDRERATPDLGTSIRQSGNK